MSVEERSEAKSLELQATESEVDVKSKTLADLEVTPTLLPDDVMELDRHEQAMPDIQSSANPDMWIGMFRHCLLRERMLKKLAVNWAKLETLPIDDLVGSIYVNLINDIRPRPFESEFAPCLMSCDDWSS